MFINFLFVDEDRCDMAGRVKLQKQSLAFIFFADKDLLAITRDHLIILIVSMMQRHLLNGMRKTHGACSFITAV